MRVCVHVCMRVCMQGVCVCVCMHVRVYVCVCMHVSKREHYHGRYILLARRDLATLSVCVRNSKLSREGWLQARVLQVPVVNAICHTLCPEWRLQALFPSAKCPTLPLLPLNLIPSLDAFDI